MQARTPVRTISDVQSSHPKLNETPMAPTVEPKREKPQVPKPWDAPAGAVYVAPSQMPAPQFAAPKPGEPVYPESGPNKSTLKKKD